MVSLKKDEEDQLTGRVVIEEVLSRVKEEKSIVHTIKRRTAKWIAHILRRNCLLEHIIEGKIEGMVRRGTRRKQLLDHCKGTRRSSRSHCLENRFERRIDMMMMMMGSRRRRMKRRRRKGM